MTKCSNCKSCMKWVWVKNKRYLYCDLCRKYFIKLSDRKIQEVNNPNTIEGVYNG